MFLQDLTALLIQYLHWALQRVSRVSALTVLQSRDGFAFLAVLAVADVVGGLHPELVRGEGLQAEE